MLNKNKLTLAVALAFALAGCVQPSQQINSSAQPEQLQKVQSKAKLKLSKVADRVLAHLEKNIPEVAIQRGIIVSTVGDRSEAAVNENANFAKEILAQLDAISMSELSHDDQLFAKMIHYKMELQTQTPEFYWYGFQVTPYQSTFSFSGINQVLSGQAINSPELRRTYIKLLKDFNRWLEDTKTRLDGQSERGILVPKQAISGVIETWEGYQKQVKALILSRQKSAIEFGDSEFLEQLSSVLNQEIVPSFASIISVFNQDYINSAPERVNLSQYPKGKEYYKYLMKHWGGYPYSPERIHEMGLRMMDKLREQRAAVRKQVGFNGTEAEFHEMLRNDPRFLAENVAEVEARYTNYLEMIEPHIDEYFALTPKAPYGVRRASPAVEKGMTYGYYQVPTPGDDKGYYVYNGSELDKRSLITAQHLIYHELIPGHHFHLALEQENTEWHPLRQFIRASNFAEGWAEYASILPEEMGLYSDPYDYYGHLVMQSFLSSRVVVDTGMNYLGWTLKQARKYMRDNTFESGVQINSETIRYATDIPAQALAYRLVRERMEQLRAKAETELGDNFDIREFHEALLNNGSLPLELLEEHINWFIEQQ